MSNNFFHAPKFHSVTINTKAIYEIGTGFLGGREVKAQWVEYFKTLRSIHWNAVVEGDGEAIYLVSNIGGGLVHPMGLSFALNIENEVNGKYLVDELICIVSRIAVRLGGTAHFDIA